MRRYTRSHRLVTPTLVASIQKPLTSCNRSLGRQFKNTSATLCAYQRAAKWNNAYATIWRLTIWKSSRVILARQREFRRVVYASGSSRRRHPPEDGCKVRRSSRGLVGETGSRFYCLQKRRLGRTGHSLNERYGIHRGE